MSQRFIKTQPLSCSDLWNKRLVESISRLWKLGSCQAILDQTPSCLTDFFDLTIAVSFKILNENGKTNQFELLSESRQPGLVMAVDALVERALPFVTEFANPEVFSYLNFARLDELRGQHIELEFEGIEFILFSLPISDTERYGLIFSEHTQEAHDFLWLFLGICFRELVSQSRLRLAEARMFVDDLTGLYNSRYMAQVVERESRRSQRSGKPFSLIFMDLDHFKKINDQFGHLVGSSILRQFARLLLKMHREVDTVIRYGGDEFVVVLLGASSAEALQVAERLREQVAAAKFVTDSELVSLTCSIGVATYPQDMECTRELLVLADERMYQSKKAGKNQVSSALFSS